MLDELAQIKTKEVPVINNWLSYFLYFLLIEMIKNHYFRFQCCRLPNLSWCHCIFGGFQLVSLKVIGE